MNKFILFLSCFLAVIADMALVIYAKKPEHPLWLILCAVIINGLGIFIWTYSMIKGIESATAITIYAVFTVIGCTMLGNILFHEHLSYINYIGIIIGVIALILISL